MTTRTEKRFIEKEVVIYTAKDGKEFSTELECVKYEEKMERNKLLEIIEKNKITGLQDWPPCDGGDYRNEDYSDAYFSRLSDCKKYVTGWELRAVADNLKCQYCEEREAGSRQGVTW